MKFRPIFALRMTHDFYTDDRCPDFLIEPNLKTERLLRNHRCVLKSLPDGIRVLTAVGNQDKPFIAFPEKMRFTFHLRLQNPDFALFTDLAYGIVVTYTGSAGGSPSVQITEGEDAASFSVKADEKRLIISNGSGKTGEEVVVAWTAWKDDNNEPHGFDIVAAGDGTSNVPNTSNRNVYLERQEEKQGSAGSPGSADLTWKWTADVNKQPAPLYTNEGLGSGDSKKLIPRFRTVWFSESFGVVQPISEENFTLRGRPLAELNPEDFKIEGSEKVKLKKYDPTGKVITVNSSDAQKDENFTVKYPIEPRLERGVFADAEIHWTNTASDRPVDDFQIVFTAKRNLWKYYFVTNLKPSKGPFKIFDMDPTAWSSESLDVVNPGLEEHPLSGQPLKGLGLNDFKIEGPAKVTLEKYHPTENKIIVASYAAKKGDKFTVKYQHKPRLDSTPVFNDVNQTDLNQNSDSSDDIAKELRKQYPDEGFQRFRFISVNPIPCRQAARKDLELHMDNNCKLKALPNPSIRNYTKTEVKSGKKQDRQDALFQVLKYITQPFPKEGG